MGPTLLDLRVSVWTFSDALDVQVFLKLEKPAELEISSSLSMIETLFHALVLRTLQLIVHAFTLS